jgi:hypothetical protein
MQAAATAAPLEAGLVRSRFSFPSFGIFERLRRKQHRIMPLSRRISRTIQITTQFGFPTI